VHDVGQGKVAELGAELKEVLRGLGDWGEKAQAYARQ